MRKLVLAAITAGLIAALPASGFAQTAPAVDGAGKQSAVMRVLAITSGAMVGMTATAILCSSVVSRAALVSIGMGSLVVAGTVVGGIAGYWMIDEK